MGYPPPSLSPSPPSSYLGGVDALDQRPCPLASPDCGLEESVDVDVVGLDGPRGRVGRGVPTDEDALVELSLEGELDRRWD